jgi:hypothetical protein
MLLFSGQFIHIPCIKLECRNAELGYVSNAGHQTTMVSYNHLPYPICYKQTMYFHQNTPDST